MGLIGWFVDASYNFLYFSSFPNGVLSISTVYWLVAFPSWGILKKISIERLACLLPIFSSWTVNNVLCKSTEKLSQWGLYAFVPMRNSLFLFLSSELFLCLNYSEKTNSGWNYLAVLEGQSSEITINFLIQPKIFFLYPEANSRNFSVQKSLGCCCFSIVI